MNSITSDKSSADFTFLHLLAHIFVASQILNEHKPSCRLSTHVFGGTCTHLDAFLNVST
jgi:hypothetical protein